MIYAALRKLKRALEELQLGKTSRSVRRDELTYLSARKLLQLEATVETITKKGVPGDILEFGVALGGSAIVLARYARDEKNFHGFDVFSMIPPPTSYKDDEKSRQRYDVIKSGRSKGLSGKDDYYGYRDNLLDDVKSSFSRYGLTVDGKRICLHKGLFEDTLPKTDIKQVCFAHVDCDWYDPVKLCLNWLDERMSSGGAILLDDYNDYGGAKTAVDEFIVEHREFVFEPGPNPLLWKQ